MKRKLLLVLTAAVSVLCLDSCLKNGIESVKGWEYVGTLKDDAATGERDTTVIYADNGMVLHITERSCEGSIKPYSRIVFICDILKTLDADNEYNIKLTGYVGMLAGNTLKTGEIQYRRDYGLDSTKVHNTWVSGGYVNVLASVKARKAHSDSHSFSLIFDEEQNDTDGGMIFYLRHNAGGDVPTEETASDFVSLGYYLSFSLEDIDYKTYTTYHIYAEWDDDGPVEPGVDPETGGDGGETGGIVTESVKGSFAPRKTIPLF